VRLTILLEVGAQRRQEITALMSREGRDWPLTSLRLLNRPWNYCLPCVHLRSDHFGVECTRESGVLPGGPCARAARPTVPLGVESGKREGAARDQPATARDREHRARRHHSRNLRPSGGNRHPSFVKPEAHRVRAPKSHAFGNMLTRPLSSRPVQGEEPFPRRGERDRLVNAKATVSAPPGP
jgi:hypothetical protein